MLSVGCLPALKAQMVEKSNLQYKNGNYNVFIIHCDAAVTKRISIIENTANVSESAYFNTLGAQSLFFSITASVVDSDCRPLGLCIENGQLLHSLNSNAGEGNFFLKPNGVLMVDSGTVKIINADNFNSKTATTAIQSGPMLVIDGKIHPAFDPGSKNKNIRCGAGIYTENGESFLVFIKSVSPVSFAEFAAIFRDEYKCSNALNLESGAYCSMHLPTVDKNYSTKTKICRYLFIRL